MSCLSTTFEATPARPTNTHTHTHMYRSLTERVRINRQRLPPGSDELLTGVMRRAWVRVKHGQRDDGDCGGLRCCSPANEPIRAAQCTAQGTAQGVAQGGGIHQSRFSGRSHFSISMDYRHCGFLKLWMYLNKGTIRVYEHLCIRNDFGTGGCGWVAGLLEGLELRPRPPSLT